MPDLLWETWDLLHFAGTLMFYVQTVVKCFHTHPLPMTFGPASENEADRMGKEDELEPGNSQAPQAPSADTTT